MKKILSIVTAALLITNVVKAGEGDDDKKFRFGLKVTPTPAWLRSADTKIVDKNGIKFGFGFGLQTEFRLTNTAHFVTGIGGDFLGGKQIYKNGQGYILSKDNAYTDSEKTNFTNGAAVTYSDNIAGNNDKFYEIKTRSIKTTYVTIPVLLKLMTKDISGFRYYGVFGGDIAIQTKFRCTDELTELKFNTTSGLYEASGDVTVSDMRPTGDLIPFNVGLNVGLGFEYNLSGSTSLFVGVNYCRGFINQYQPTSEIMVDQIKTSMNTGVKPSRSKQSAMSDGVQINIGMLF
ncbi:MAG: outer membrane beta-barrel protein [Bacteroidia bacterium]|nr:outer membrane beta-barrel protein [Bacteroidia bacterium]